MVVVVEARRALVQHGNLNDNWEQKQASTTRRERRKRHTQPFEKCSHLWRVSFRWRAADLSSPLGTMPTDDEEEDILVGGELFVCVCVVCVVSLQTAGISPREFAVSTFGRVFFEIFCEFSPLRTYKNSLPLSPAEPVVFDAEAKLLTNKTRTGKSGEDQQPDHSI